MMTDQAVKISDFPLNAFLDSLAGDEIILSVRDYDRLLQCLA